MRKAGETLGAGWIYPKGFVAPEPAPPGYCLVTETSVFMGLYVRWRYVREEIK